MTSLADKLDAARERALDAADIMPDVTDGLLELVEQRRRSYAAEQKLLEDLAAIELTRDELDEQDVRVKERRKDADKAVKELDALAGELGKAAFTAFELGELDRNPLYDERRTSRDEVEKIEGEIAELGQAKGFGAVVKAKARQAALLARSTATKARFRSQERDIGRSLIEERAEESVRCSGTEVVLSKILGARESVRQLDRLLNSANAERIATGQLAEDRYSLDTVRAPKDLKPAIKRIETGMAAARKEQAQANRDVLQRLDVAMSLGELPHDSEPWIASRALRDIKAEIAANDE
jgi:hypothetical protein